DANQEKRSADRDVLRDLTACAAVRAIGDPARGRRKRACPADPVAAAGAVRRYLASSWLIENRYSIIPFALWMVLRTNGSDRADRIRLVIRVLVSQFFVWGIFSGRFML